MKIRQKAKQAYGAFVEWSNTPESYKQFQRAFYTLSGQEAADRVCETIDETIADKRARGYIKMGLAVAALWPKPALFRTVAPVAMLSVARRGLIDIGILTPPE